MKRLVEFPMEDGSTILVEVDEPGYAGGTLRSIKPGDMIERAGMTYEQAISRVQPAAASIIARLRAMPEPPTEVAIELGISLSAEAGAFLASAATQAHIIVTLTWKAHRHDIVAAPGLPLPDANDNYEEEES